MKITTKHPKHGTVTFEDKELTVRKEEALNYLIEKGKAHGHLIKENEVLKRRIRELEEKVILSS